MDNKMIPLSDEGVSLAKIKSMSFSNIDKCYSSSYKRAFETAELIADKVTIIDALHERELGMRMKIFG
jgi:broad specificity phosphatase PhoE